MGGGSASSRASPAGFGFRVVASAASRRPWPAPWRSPTKRPTNFTKATKTPHSPIHRKQRTAHCERRRHARDITAECGEDTAVTSITRAKSRSNERTERENRGWTWQRSRVDKHAQTQPQTDHQTRRTYETHTNPVSGTNKTQSPSTHRRPEKTQTKEGDRSPDQTRPPDPQRRPTDPPESALTSNYRSISGLEVDGAAEFGALRRLRRRPRRQPAVSATARACPLLQTRPS